LLVVKTTLVPEGDRPPVTGLEWLAKPVGSYEAEPIVLAEDSESADVTADLVDVGQWNERKVITRGKM